MTNWKVQIKPKPLSWSVLICLPFKQRISEENLQLDAFCSNLPTLCGPDSIGWMDNFLWCTSKISLKKLSSLTLTSLLMTWGDSVSSSNMSSSKSSRISSNIRDEHTCPAKSSILQVSFTIIFSKISPKKLQENNCESPFSEGGQVLLDRCFPGVFAKVFTNIFFRAPLGNCMCLVNKTTFQKQLIFFNWPNVSLVVIKKSKLSKKVNFERTCLRKY